MDFSASGSDLQFLPDPLADTLALFQENCILRNIIQFDISYEAILERW